MATTIKVSKKTKRLLDSLLAELEAEHGRRMTYDEAIRALIERSRPRNPALLRRLAGMAAEPGLAEEAHRLLEEEARLEEMKFERRYSGRHERSR